MFDMLLEKELSGVHPSFRERSEDALAVNSALMETAAATSTSAAPMVERLLSTMKALVISSFDGSYRTFRKRRASVCA